MFKNLILSTFAVSILTSCGEQAEKIDPLRRGDKNLSCKEILLELNEAEFYRKQANEKKQLGIKSIVMPLGYIDTYMSADEAVGAANSRVSYLNRIFEIKRCDEGDQPSDAEIQAKISQGIQRVSPQQSGGKQIPVIYQQPTFQGGGYLYQGQ